MRVGVARRRHRVSLETVSVTLPFGIGLMAWKVDTTQKKAVWSLYVELGDAHCCINLWKLTRVWYEKRLSYY
ncbi:hypothetical protein [Nostoc sp. C052]|uniref:hypothetical protein n=1 Tax=Nostoc sp. C052 TaxID=2576902 RepID=UPI0035684741